jgi:aryl carrier-like protein
MEHLGLTPDEIVDRLSSTMKPRPSLDAPFVPPRSGSENMLAECWSEVMKLERLGVHDNFFLLGGESLQMTQIMARIRERCGAELSFDQFFECPTIAELAQLLDKFSESVPSQTNKTPTPSKLSL